ncbi:hypothetical protein T01_3349 [Trichinella spiralis]|uniref:Uncharacterized protein n=1 Tax=Trichinella spiralis TaxID=6334 RepID=A0A0V1BDJ3_TRISP|nr:hypothetical protein T01_3349 [Trichinella spiralis]
MVPVSPQLIAGTAVALSECLSRHLAELRPLTTTSIVYVRHQFLAAACVEKAFDEIMTWDLLKHMIPLNNLQLFQNAIRKSTRQCNENLLDNKRQRSIVKLNCGLLLSAGNDNASTCALLIYLWILCKVERSLCVHAFACRQCVVLSLFARFVCFNRIAPAKVYISRFNRLDARREPICGSEDKWQQWTAN